MEALWTVREGGCKGQRFEHARVQRPFVAIRGQSGSAREVLRRCSRDAQKVLKGCSGGAQRVLKGCSRGAQEMLWGCSGGAHTVTSTCTKSRLKPSAVNCAAMSSHAHCEPPRNPKQPKGR